MIILLVGGGSGGHVSPLLAVAHELKQSDIDNRLVYVGEKNGKFVKLAINSESFDEIKTVRAGKFRRYHGENWLKRILDVKTLFLNIRDFFFMIIGTFQSIRIVHKVKPDVAFIKGGFVGVPVGLACVLTRTKFITHDSDTVPGLANRIVSKWASWHAVGMPVEYYDYDKSTTSFTGIPIETGFKPVTEDDLKKYRDELSIPYDAKVICISGGSLGATRLNTAIGPLMAELMSKDQKVFVIHQTGPQNNDLYSDLDKETKKRIILAEFFSDLYKYTGASDVIITRAGATTIASLAMQKKPIIVIPNPLLTGGHQSKNAQHLEHAKAAIVIKEEDVKFDIVSSAINRILMDEDYAKSLSDNLGLLARPNATKEITKLIEKIVKNK